MWTLREVKKTNCAVGDETVILPDNVRPGDIIECHGVRQRVTLEFGAHAFVNVELSGPSGRPSTAGPGH